MANISDYISSKARSIRDALGLSPMGLSPQIDPVSSMRVTQNTSYNPPSFNTRLKSFYTGMMESNNGDVLKKNLGYQNPQTLGQKATNAGLGVVDSLTSAPIRAGYNMYKPVIEAGFAIPDYIQGKTPQFTSPRDYLGGLQQNIGLAARSAGTAMAVAAPYAAAPAVALYSGLEGGLNVLNDKSDKSMGMKFAEGAVGNLDRGIAMAGIGAVSNPLIEKATKGMPLLGRLGAGVPMNIAEGYAMNKSAGMDYTKEDALIDTLVPVGLETGKLGLDQIKSFIKKGVSDGRVTKEVGKQLENYIEKNGRKYWNGRLNGGYASKADLEAFKKNPLKQVRDYYFKQTFTDINTGTTKTRFQKVTDSALNLARDWQNKEIYNKDGKLITTTDRILKAIADNPELAVFAPTSIPEITYDENGKIQIKQPDGYNLPTRVGLFALAQGTKSEAGQKTLKNVMSGADEVINTFKKQIGETEVKIPMKNKIGGAWDTFYRDWVNRFQPVEDLVKKVEKQGNMSLLPENNPTIQIKRLLGAGGIAEYRHKTKLQPILDSIKNDISIEDFDVFLKAKRDIELAGRGVKGSDAGQANTVIQALGSKYNLPKIEEAANQLYKYQDEGLQMLRDSGFIDESVYNVIKDANKNYVPFQRVMDEVDNYLGLPTSKLQNPGQPLKKIEGSNRAIYSPIESIIANTYKIESAVSKNKVAKTLAGLSNLGEEFRQLVKPVAKSGDNTISVWDNGTKAFFEVDADISQAVKGLNEEQLSTVWKILSAPASILRQQATGRNISFMIPNIVRDQFEAAINAKYGYVPFWDYMRGLKDLIQYEATGSNPIVEGWIQNGGQMFFDSMGGRKAIQKQIMDATTKKRFLRRLYDLAISGIETVGRYSETPTRLGVYKRALEKTGNAAISAAESRESTLDFARRGAKTQVVNSVIPFFNVDIQGIDRLLRSVQDRPAKTLALMTVYGGVPALTTALYNNLYHGEDYAQVPDFVKDNNFVVMTGEYDSEGNPEYISVPKAYGVQPIANSTQQLIDYWKGINPKTFKQFALQTLSSSTPVLGEGDSFSSIAINTVGNNIPQFAKPSIEQAANFNFFRQKQIVPNYLQNKPSEMQFNRATPEIYKKVGALTGSSPMRLQAFADSTLPAVKESLNLVDTLGSIKNGDPLNPNKIPILKRFKGSYSGFDNERPVETGGMSAMERINEFLRPTSKSSAASKEPITLDEKTIRKVDNIAKTYGYDSYLQEKPTGSLELKKYQSEVLSQAKKAMKDEYMKEADKLALVQRMGYDAEDVKYDILANSETVDRAIYVRDELKKAKNQEEALKILSDLYNNKSLSNSRVFTESVAKELGLEDVYKKIVKLSKPSKAKKLKVSKPKPIKISETKIPTSKQRVSLKAKETPQVNANVNELRQIGEQAKLKAKQLPKIKLNPKIAGMMRNA